MKTPEKLNLAFAVVQVIYVLMLLLEMLCEVILTDTRFSMCNMIVGLGKETILASFSERQDVF